MNHYKKSMPRTYEFVQHQPRLQTSTGSPTASWEVKGEPIMILLSTVPELLLNHASPGDAKGNYFHYMGSIASIRGESLPDRDELITIIHNLVEYEVSFELLRGRMLDVGPKSVQFQAALSGGLEKDEYGERIIFAISIHMAEEAILNLVFEQLHVMQHNQAKLEEMREVAQAARQEANKAVASAASDTQH